MFAETTSIEAFDSELFAAIVDEARRQEEHIELIASENYASPRVLEVQGSVLTNKYAEGYPGKRYTLTLPNSLQSTGRKNCSVRTMPTCSLIPAPRRMRRPSLHCSNRATRSSA